MNSEDDKAQEYVEKMRSLMDLYFRDLLPVFKSGRCVDLIQDWPKSPDFYGKIPVFVCWWQGFANAPEIVKICRNSIAHIVQRCKEITRKNRPFFNKMPFCGA